jgi:thiosulfate/3-mercaptopyruvate sulfurtransferase
MFSRLAALTVFVGLLFGLAVPAWAESSQPLVTPQWLNEHRQDAEVVILDIRSALDGGGEKAYLAAHIPGSVHSDYDKGGWRVMRNSVPFMLPSVPELDALIGDLGIEEGSHVIVVPAGVSYTDFGAAARVYWTLKVAGVQNVSILDGGIAAWNAAGLPLGSGNEAPAPKIFNAKLDKCLIAETDDVLRIVKNTHKATLIDARSRSFFSGKEKAPKISAYGHIPGAIDLDSADFYDEQTNRLKPAEQLKEIAKRIPSSEPAISYCNTGHWAATDWFVLHELLGRTSARLYAGSLVEWSADARRPVASDRTKWDDRKKALGIGS